MKKTIFRPAEVVELIILIAVCFSFEVACDVIRTMDIQSYILREYLNVFLEHETVFGVSITIIMAVYFYKIVERKHKEVLCRVISGDSVKYIRLRYALVCNMILSVIYAVLLIADFCCGFRDFVENIVAGMILAYIFISMIRIRI